MKARLLYFLVALAMVGVIPTATVLGQAAASVTWNCIAPDSQKVSSTVGNVTGQPISGTPSFVIISYSGTAGGGAGPLGSNFMRWNPGSGVMWGPETSPVDSHYVQLVAAPKVGNDFTVDSISVYSSGGGTSNMKVFVYYSTDPAFATKTKINPDTISLPNSSTAYVRLAYPVGAKIKSGQSFYLRFYPWYTSTASSSKYFYTQLAVIKGTTSPATGVGEDVQGFVPSEMRLYQNYPNPFNPSTTIKFALAHRTAVKIAVYNVLGEEIRLLVNGEKEAGMHQVQFTADGVPSGVYFVNMRADGFSETTAIHLVK